MASAFRSARRGRIPRSQVRTRCAAAAPAPGSGPAESGPAASGPAGLGPDASRPTGCSLPNVESPVAEPPAAGSPPPGGAARRPSSPAPSRPTAASLPIVSGDHTVGSRGPAGHHPARMTAPSSTRSRSVPRSLPGKPARIGGVRDLRLLAAERDPDTVESASPEEGASMTVARSAGDVVGAGSVGATIDRASPADLVMLAVDTGPVPQQLGALLLLDNGSDLDPAAMLRVIADRATTIPRPVSS